MTNPTAALRSKVKDPTAALRVRRHRAKKKLNGTKPLLTAARRRASISTPQMCALAARVADGRATPADLKLAERLIMALVDRLPADSAIDVG